MTEDKNNEMIVLLAQDALEAADQAPSVATVLLIDAALAVVASKMPHDAARQMSAALAAYVVEQTDAVITARLAIVGGRN